MVELYEHNQKTYENIKELFVTHNRVACVQPTGTGKSFIMLKLIEDNPDKKFLITSPSVYIFEQIRTHAEDSGVDISNCEFFTYQKIVYMSEESVRNIDVDYIITDEFHRLGSAEWGGKGMECLLNTHENSKVLGTSATPIRYLDCMRNMAEELFDSCYAVNMNLAEAIKLKILPLPIYITAWYSFSGELAKMEKKLQNTGNEYLKNKVYASIQKAKSMLTDTECGMEKVLEKHIENKNGKYIIFCPNVESLENAQIECGSWFKAVNKNIHIYSVYTYGDDVKSQFECFKNDESENALKLLLCIDMLNEGVHIKGIDGVIMLRATKSANVFYQQLGRALSCSKSRPVIFDIVNNYETGDTAEIYKSIMEIGRKYYPEDSVKNITFEIYDYVRDIRTLLDDIYNTFEQSWETTFDMLCEFVREFKRFPQNNDEYKGYRIGKWCMSQRQLYKSSGLTDGQIKSLESIGFVWNKNDAIWERYYNSLREIYLKLKRFPEYSDIEDDGLRKWITVQRQRLNKNKLSDEKIQKLMEIEFVWDVEEKRWNDSFEILKKFIDENGRVPSTGDKWCGLSIGQWYRKQCLCMSKGLLSAERCDKLKSLDVELTSFIDSQWYKRFEQLKTFISKYGRYPRRSESYEGFNLYGWVNIQKRKLEKNKLEEKYIKAFEEINLDLMNFSTDSYGELWFKRFELLERFIKEYGRLPCSGETFEGFDVYWWLNHQKLSLKNNELDDRYLKKFESLNIDLLNSSMSIDDRWEINFELLKRFISEYGRCPFKDETYENVDIYGWLIRQKKKIKCNELPSEYIKKLEGLNIDILNFSSRSSHRSKAWEEKFKLLSDFISKNSRFPKDGELYGGTDLYKWLIKEKNRLKKYDLEESYAEKLKSLNINLSEFPSDRRNLWMQRFEQLKTFIDEFDRYPYSGETYGGFQPYAWILMQKRKLNKNRLDDEYLEKFKSINIDLVNFSASRPTELK